MGSVYGYVQKSILKLGRVFWCEAQMLLALVHLLPPRLGGQQDRQNQTEAELKNAHKYKIDSEEKIKKLEHMIMSLRYHLQAQQAPVGNDFLNSSHRPPDVF